MKPLGTLALCTILVILAVSSHPAQARKCKDPDNVTFVQGKRHCLAIKTFAGAAGADTLFVVLHGDLSRGGPRARGLDAEFVLVEGAGHGLNRRYHEPLTEAIEQLLAR